MKKGLLRRIWNRCLGQLARTLPGATSLRPFLHRLRGVRMSGTIFIGDDVYLENEYPECIEIHPGAQLCLKSVFIAHTRGAGRIVIGKDTFIGARCIVTAPPGRTLTIGEGSIITAATVISSDVPPHTLFGSDKGRVLARATVPLTMQTSYTEFLAGLKPTGRPGSEGGEQPESAR